MSFCIGWFFSCPSLPRGFWTCVVTTPTLSWEQRSLEVHPEGKGMDGSAKFHSIFRLHLSSSRGRTSMFGTMLTFSREENLRSLLKRRFGVICMERLFLELIFGLSQPSLGRKPEHGYLLNDVFGPKTVPRNTTQSRVCTLKWMFMSISTFSWNLRY